MHTTLAELQQWEPVPDSRDLHSLLSWLRMESLPSAPTPKHFLESSILQTAILGEAVSTQGLELLFLLATSMRKGCMSLVGSHRRRIYGNILSLLFSPRWEVGEVAITMLVGSRQQVQAATSIWNNLGVAPLPTYGADVHVPLHWWNLHTNPAHRQNIFTHTHPISLARETDGDISP